MKETEDDTNEWKDTPGSWIRRINVVRMFLLCKGIRRFNAIPIQMPTAFFYRTRTNNPKIRMEPQKTLNSQSNFEKEQSWRHRNPRFQGTVQGYSNQNSMMLAQKWTHRSIEEKAHK